MSEGSEEVGRLRIAVGTLFQESNTFTGTRTELSDFEALLLRTGGPVDDLYGGTSEVAGILATVQQADALVVPLLFARASPGGRLSSSCWDALQTRLLGCLADAGDVNAVVLALHGAMAVDDMLDPEGALLTSIRRLVGPEVPVVASLDLHAHVTELMVTATQGLFPYQQYPHDDAWQAGERAARFALRLADGEPWPPVTLKKINMLSPAINAGTFDGPMARVARLTAELNAQAPPEVVEVSFLHVHPWIDEPAMGNGAMAIGGSAEQRELLTQAVVDQLWEERFNLEAPLCSIEEAIEIVSQGIGPYVLVDSADCVGGGAAGDTVSALRALLTSKVKGPVYLPVIDPGVASHCCDLEVGAVVEVKLGHALDRQWGEPLDVRGRVEATARDVHLTYSGGIYGGMEAYMGDCAVIHVGRDVHVLVASRPTYEYGDEQFAALGLDVRQARVLVAKNPMNCRTAYGAWVRQFVDVDLPGPTSNQLLGLSYPRGGPERFPFIGRERLARYKATHFSRQGARPG